METYKHLVAQSSESSIYVGRRIDADATSVCPPVLWACIRKARMLRKEGKAKDAVRVLRDHVDSEVGESSHHYPELFGCRVMLVAKSL
jgi:hypothetical protein